MSETPLRPKYKRCRVYGVGAWASTKRPAWNPIQTLCWIAFMEPYTRLCYETLRGGSWVVISRVITPRIRVITIYSCPTSNPTCNYPKPYRTLLGTLLYNPIHMNLQVSASFRRVNVPSPWTCSKYLGRRIQGSEFMCMYINLYIYIHI